MRVQKVAHHAAIEMMQTQEYNKGPNAAAAQLMLESLALADVCIYQRLDSTNTQAMRDLAAGKRCPFLVLARQQTAGKGRRGRVWESPVGAGLYYSLAIELKIENRNLAALSLVTALSVYTALTELGVTGLKLKWPNDLLNQDRKLSGILLESMFRGGSQFLVFGIGVNLNLPEEVRASLGRPVTDLEALGLQAANPDQIASTITRHLLGNVDGFMQTGFAGFQAEWNRLDAFIGQAIEAKLGDQNIFGKMLGVNEFGELRVLTEQGQEVLRGGEILPSVERQSKSGEQP